MRSFPLLKCYLTLMFPYGDGPHAQGPYTERIDIAAKFCFKECQCRSMNCFSERQIPASHFADPSSPDHVLLQFSQSCSHRPVTWTQQPDKTELPTTPTGIKSESWFVPPSSYATAKCSERGVMKHRQAQRKGGEQHCPFCRHTNLDYIQAGFGYTFGYGRTGLSPFTVASYIRLGTTQNPESDGNNC